jgi:predicted metal-dependent hydrolase
MTLERGVDLFNRGLYWEAHEAWEEAWIPDRKGPDSGFYKGLIQVAAGCLHYRRRNRRGALNKWRSGADYLRPYLPSHHDIAVEPLLHSVDRCRDSLERYGWQALELPTIEMLRRDPAHTRDPIQE